MRGLFVFVAMSVASVAAAEDRPIFLVTPGGVYQSIVDSTGKPGPWTPIAADVIVQGFTDSGPRPTPVPVPPVTPVPPADPVVSQIAAISTRVLQDSDEATAVGAIIDTMARYEAVDRDGKKIKLSDKEFREGLEMATPIVDKSLDAGGRLTEWMRQALFVTSDAKQMKAGLAFAFGIQQSTLDSIHDAAENPDEVPTGEAIDWTRLIAIIQMILTLLKSLGIGGK